MNEARRWLLRRIAMEGHAFANADATTKQLRRGRVLAFLEVGVELGCWTERSASHAADLIENRQSLRRLHRVLRVPGSS